MKIGILQPGAKPIGIGNSGAMRGLVYISGVNHACIVKKCDSPEELAAECFCAFLARELSLTAPEPILVFDGTQYIFGSLDATYPNLLSLWNIDPNNPDLSVLELLVSDLASWTGCGRLVAFDLLIDNADRHPGNLLFDGQDYTLIDHARTLGIYSSNQKLVGLLDKFLKDLNRATLNASVTSAALTFNAVAPIVSGDHILTATQVAAFRDRFVKFVETKLPTIAATGANLLC